MRVDQLMDAIEEIDDRYIEESAYGVRRKSNIPWGMIITAACFCMVIGATMLMQSLGILPHLSGTEASSQPTISPTTNSSEPTVPQPTVVLPSPERFFSQKGTMHNEALGWCFGGEGAVQCFYLLGDGELGQSAELTEQEKTLLDSKLHFGIDYAEVWRLTPEQIENAFWSVYGLTWEQIMANFHPEMHSSFTWMILAPVYLEETGYYYGYIRNTEVVGTEIADIETEYFDDGSIYMFYTAVSQKERRVAKLRPHATGYHILSNTLIERFEEPIDPAAENAIRDLFADESKWYRQALVDTFAAPNELHLRYYFYNSAEFGEGLQPTKEEMDELMAWEDYQEGKTLTILPVSKMDAVLTEVFDITVAEMGSKAFAGMKYVESIDSWCFWGAGRMNTPQITIRDVVKLVGDGFAVLCNDGGHRNCQINLQPHGDSYRIESVIIGEYIPRPSVEKLFCDRGSWYNLALVSFSETPQKISLSNMFSRTYSGEPVVLTDYEKSALKELLTNAGAGQITRYTAEQIDEVLLLCFNKTAEELGVDLESHFTYLKETNCYYGLYWGTPGVSIENVRTEECEDGTVNLYFTYGYDRIAKLQPHNTGYYILSTEKYVDNTGKTEDQIAMEALFGDYNSWFNRAIACEYDSPKEMSLIRFFYGGFKGEPQDPTDQEREQLENLGINLNYDLMRLPVDKMNEVLTEYFGITLADMEPEAFGGLVYLESTNCYYHSTSGWLGVENFEALSVERMDDGRILVRYPHRNEEYVVTLKPYGESYLILSNERYVDNTGKSEDQIAMEEFFKSSSWFNQALTCEYDSPEQIGILSFFNEGFSNNKQVTDEEKAQLKNMQGFGLPWGDIYRLPPDKMNAVLTECFGITLEDVDPAGFNGLAYLESTNCYYFKASAPNFVENFKADRVERNSDGTIDVYYNISYKGDYVVTIKPHGDGYRILSNRCINSTPLIPQTPKEPTGDTELEKLFADYGKMPEKELSQKMVDMFLADPDTFVKLLAKQEWYGGILGVLSRNVTDNYPQIGAYRVAVGSLLANELPEKERIIVCGMAVYSGLSNYIPNTPEAADYRMLLGMMDNYSFEGETAELLRKFCIEDAAGVIAVIVQDKESQTIYIERITALTSEEELKQLKQSMTQLISELKNSTDTGVQEQIKCAEMIIESCDEEIG